MDDVEQAEDLADPAAHDDLAFADLAEGPAVLALRAVDRDERPVLLVESPWHLTYMQQQNPNLELATPG